MPPEMITIVAPTAMMAKKLASVPTWISVCELRKLLTGTPVRRSTWVPANAVSTAPSSTMMATRPACCDARSFRNIRARDKTVDRCALSICRESRSSSESYPAAEFLAAGGADFEGQVQRLAPVGRRGLLHRHSFEKRVRQSAGDLRVIARLVAPVVSKPRVSRAQSSRAAEHQP